jgi:hypothetical protein
MALVQLGVATGCGRPRQCVRAGGGMVGGVRWEALRARRSRATRQGSPGHVTTIEAETTKHVSGAGGLKNTLSTVPRRPSSRGIMVVRGSHLTAMFVAVVLSADVFAEREVELVQNHVEAMGGRQRIEALSAVRATGYVEAGGKRLRFTMFAQRPNRVRVETQGGGRTLVQGSDGREPPWEFDTGTWPPQYQPMAEPAAKTFAADAEFDDPLVAGKSRGYTLKFAGETELDGRKLLRLRVTRDSAEAFAVLLDATTHLIVLRIEPRLSADGRKIQVVTHYDDFRLVEGVLLPHEISVAVEGKLTQRTRIEEIEPNPHLTAETFSRPNPRSP